MGDVLRVEMPLRESSKLFSSCKTIGDLEKKYSKLNFVKYIYLDPKDNKLKGTNPPSSIPLIPNSYITVMGEIDEVIKFTKEATKK